ncbi:MAG: molybdenum cofactor biosynthesis protein MoaE [Hyphomicrobiales bacterium]
MIRVQQEPFDTARELDAIKGGNTKIGGVACFIGTVRELTGGDAISAMTLEHYPGMTEKALEEIEREALGRWPLEASLIVHRYGRLEPGDDIVLVIAAAAHRQDAFDACQFLIDWLKTKAPFWKSEDGASGDRWVEARDTDDAAAERWTDREKISSD